MKSEVRNIDKMNTISSISGGKTSAFMAVHYPTDYNMFALVRTEDKDCMYPDAKVRQMVEDRIQKPFIGTLEDDLIITTIFELEQFMGREIVWVSGITYDEVIRTKGGWLPNKLHRYCTSHLKIEPMFYWCVEHTGLPIQMNIGYRANEARRVKKMNLNANEDGLQVFDATFEKNGRGQNKWEEIGWEKTNFPLYDNGIYKDAIVNYWKDKPVTFAALNNCVGCFHRNPLLLAKMFQCHPNKMNWFKEQERIKRAKDKRATWRTDVTYTQIANYSLQNELNIEDFDECDSGHCTN